MASYLRIQNEGVADLGIFTRIGASTSRGDVSRIGQFGSGKIMGVLTSLRHAITPVVFCGTTRITYTVENAQCGTDPRGNSVWYTPVSYAISNRKPVDMGVVLEYGSLDWTNIGMALREFISNAIDNSTNGMDGVVVDLVENPTPRVGKTVVYIEATPDVLEYFAHLSDNFLHFRGEVPFGVVEKKVPGPPQVYRKNVRFDLDEPTHSLFDYNSEDIQIDESRNLEASQCVRACAKLLVKDNKATKRLITSLIRGEKSWESGWSEWSIQWVVMGESAGVLAAWKMVCGSALVANSTHGIITDHAVNHGFTVKTVCDNWYTLLKDCGVPTVMDGVGNLDKNGFEILPPTTNVQNILDKVHACFQLIGVETEKPSVHLFRPLMEVAKNRLGDYNPADASIGIREDHIDCEETMVHEMCHHIAEGANDATREFESAMVHTILNAFRTLDLLTQ